MEPEKIPRRFDFARDSFTFANELVWEYQFDTASGKMNFRPRVPKPDYAHRCFVLARAARQFLYHAYFDAEQEIAGDPVYQQRVCEVVSRNPRMPSESDKKIAIPGYASLREFSAARGKLLKANCGGAWRSYTLRSHWRMVLPISRAHQERTAARLVAALAQNISPIIHLVKFPALTINHGMILFDVVATKDNFKFSGYDPNDPSQPVNLIFNVAEKAFSLPANHYWPGGELNVIEIYRSWLM